MDKTFGILNLSSRTITTNNKSLFKKFTSILDNSVFDVKTKRTELKDVFATVSIKDKCILDYYDNVEDIKIPLIIMKLNWSNCLKNINITDLPDLTPNRIDLTNIPSFTIDPLNSLDRDDALSIERNNDGYIVYIHISDPTSFITEDSIIDKELANRCFSIYLKDNVNNMMPNVLSQELISLTEGQTCRTFTCKVILDTEFNIKSYEFFKALIKPINLTYEQADILKETNTDLLKLYDFAKNLKYNKENDYDIHIMVANYMILCNELVATFLQDVNCIFRYNDSTPIDDVSDNKLFKLNKQVKHKRAVYSVENKQHSILKLKYYTHFTSPIRRYSDIVVHRILFNKISNKKEYDISYLENICNKLNEIQKNYKYAYMLEKMFLTFKDDITELYGYIIFIGENVKIYNEEYDIILSFNILHKTLKNVIEINCENTKITLRNKLDSQITLELYQRIKFKLYKFKTNIKFYQIQLIEPSLTEFLLSV